MSAPSSPIEWTQTTWNPVTGCDRISAGCDHCYALTLARRLKAMGQPRYQADGNPVTSGPGFAVTTHPDALGEPLRWRRPRLVFVNSMSDLGHARVPRSFLVQVWATMARTPRHTYQILTKRPERLRRLLDDTCQTHDCHGGHLPGVHFRSDVQWATHLAADQRDLMRGWPLPNVWLGTSIEHAATLHRLDPLRQTPATLRFLSLEPLLGPLPDLDLAGIGWVIVGGESGPGARPMRLEWAREIVESCRAAGVAVFVKQLGTVAGREHGCQDAKGGDWDAWPADLRIRQLPDRSPAATSATTSATTSAGVRR